VGGGIVDLYFKGPLFFRHEAAFSNVVTGVFFGLTLRGEKSIIQEFAERRALATGNVTFYALLFMSIFMARPIILLLRRVGLAPSTRPPCAPLPEPR
jgi:hypothetical protein